MLGKIKYFLLDHLSHINFSVLTMQVVFFLRISPS